MSDEPESGVEVLIVGAAGMLGRRLAQELARRGALGTRPIAQLVLADVVEPPVPPTTSVGAIESIVVNIGDPQAVSRLVASRPDVVFHLAAVVSGEAEADLEKGYAVNVDATRGLLEAIRIEGSRADYCPRVVFTSSIAVFGGPFPERIGDEFLTAPATSYGTQKVMSELLVSDYSRRGFLDGISLRLPTICVRPGAPNRAASGFYSNIMREPLVGKPAVLPVDSSVRHWFASPRSAVGFLTHAATLDTAQLGVRRALNMPGVTATVAEQIAALHRLAGQEAVDLIRHEPDPQIAELVSTWPQDFEAERALELGFVADASFEDILRVHVEDELGGEVGGE